MQKLETGKLLNIRFSISCRTSVLWKLVTARFDVYVRNSENSDVIIISPFPPFPPVDSLFPKLSLSLSLSLAHRRHSLFFVVGKTFRFLGKSEKDARSRTYLHTYTYNTYANFERTHARLKFRYIAPLDEWSYILMETPPCWSISLSECTGGDSREKSFWQKKKPQLVNGGLSRIGSSHLRTEAGGRKKAVFLVIHPLLFFSRWPPTHPARFYLFTGRATDVLPVKG